MLIVSSLFAVAMEKGLVDEVGVLVARRKSAGGKSVKWKYMGCLDAGGLYQG